MRTLLIVLVSSGIALTGCGGNGNDAPADTDEHEQEIADACPDNPLLGAWEVTEVIEGPDYSNTGTVYVFNADGTMSSSMGSFANEGNFTVTGDTLTILMGSVSMDILIGFDEGRLVYDIVNGDQKFLMERI